MKAPTCSLHAATLPFLHAAMDAIVVIKFHAIAHRRLCGHHLAPSSFSINIASRFPRRDWTLL